MLKELGTYDFNGQKAVFTTGVEKDTFKTYPMAYFTFPDGSVIKCKHDRLNQTTIYSHAIKPKVDYKDGAWIIENGN